MWIRHSDFRVLYYFSQIWYTYQRVNNTSWTPLLFISSIQFCSCIRCNPMIYSWWFLPADIRFNLTTSIWMATNHIFYTTFFHTIFTISLASQSFGHCEFWADSFTEFSRHLDQNYKKEPTDLDKRRKYEKSHRLAEKSESKKKVRRKCACCCGLKFVL